MTFQQYVDNPMGKRNAVFSQREEYKETYTKKFDALFMREAGKINYTLYIDRKNDTYFAHIKIPSEAVPNLYYDVVIKIFTKDNGLRVSNSLKEYEVQFFSNDPSFVYTYEYVFRKNDMYVKELSSKSTILARKKPPEVTNSYQIPGYVKSIYFAYLFMRRANLFSKDMYVNNGRQYSRVSLLNAVDSFEKKCQEYNDKAAKEKKKKKLEKNTPKGSIQDDSSDDGGKFVKRTKVGKTVPSVKSAKTVGTVGKIGAKRRNSKF